DVMATVTARRGAVSFSPDYSKLIMDLFDGEIHELDIPAQSQYRKIRFEKHRIAMNAEGFDFRRSQENAFQRGDRELSAEDMMHIVDSLQSIRKEYERRALDKVLTDLQALLDAPARPIDPKPSAPQLPSRYTAVTRLMMLKNAVEPQFFQIKELRRTEREYLVEIHKKYAIPAACVIFVLIGAPLGIMARKGTFGVAASLSLGFFLIYWACLIGGEKLADRGFLEPWVGMWIANIGLGILGVYLTVRMARESLTINWGALRRLVPKRWQSEGEVPDDPP
ncbi:MAG TPA: LptF/LptG family permease, partial [Bacteroidota bacterium]